jgi:alpha-tubulin suppressor-like RCC1 family protein
MNMGRILPLIALFSLYFAACTPQSKFKKGQAIIPGSTSGGDTDPSGITALETIPSSGSSIQTPAVVGIVHSASISRVILYVPKPNPDATATPRIINCGTQVGSGNAIDFDLGENGENLDDEGEPIISGIVATNLPYQYDGEIYVKSEKESSGSTVRSECSHAHVHYRHSVPNGALVFVSVTPSQMPSSVINPVVKVSAGTNTGITSVNFFAEAPTAGGTTCSCGGTAIPANITTQGSERTAQSSITVAANAVTNICAKAVGATLSNPNCQKLITYTHDNLGPTFASDAKLTHVLYSESLTALPNVTWSGATDDGSNAITYEYKVYKDGALVKTDHVSNRSLIGVSMTMEQGPAYAITVQAFDELGNASTQILNANLTQVWHVDATPPKLLVVSPAPISPAPNAVVVGRTATISGYCVPGQTIDISHRVEANTTSGPTTTSCAANETFSFDIQIVGAAGSRTVTLSQADSAGIDASGKKTLPFSFDFAPLSDFGSTIAAGRSHSCVSRSGQMSCWGLAANGRLGIGNAFTDQSAPQYIPFSGSAATFEQISVGDRHTCVIRSDKNVYCWGSNAWGQLGDPNSSDRDSAVRVHITNADEKIIQISAGAYHTCAMDSGNNIYCWGNNEQRQLGPSVANVASMPTPTAVILGLSGTAHATAVSAGDYFTCASISDGTIRCWGANSEGQLGIDRAVTQPESVGPNPADFVVSPTEVSKYPLAANETYTQVSAGPRYACALTSAQRIFCWGSNFGGGLGVNLSPQPTRYLKPTIQVGAPAGILFKKIIAKGTNIIPGPVPTTPTSASSQAVKDAYNSYIAAMNDAKSNQLVCAISTSNALYCWASLNAFGQMGVNIVHNGATTPPFRTPTLVYGGLQFSDVSVGAVHICAKDMSNAVYCWGATANGRLGIGNVNSGEAYKATPTRLPAF